MISSVIKSTVNLRLPLATLAPLTRDLTRPSLFEFRMSTIFSICINSWPSFAIQIEIFWLPSSTHQYKFYQLTVITKVINKNNLFDEIFRTSIQNAYYGAQKSWSCFIMKCDYNTCWWERFIRISRAKALAVSVIWNFSIWWKFVTCFLIEFIFQVSIFSWF